MLICFVLFACFVDVARVVCFILFLNLFVAFVFSCCWLFCCLLLFSLLVDDDYVPVVLS